MIFTIKMYFIPRLGFQSFFKELTQISPLAATLGWKILVRKKPLGGAVGKSLPSTSFTRNCPPAKGVSTEKKKLD